MKKFVFTSILISLLFTTNLQSSNSEFNLDCYAAAVAIADYQLANGIITSAQYFGVVLHYISVCSEQ